MSDYKKTYETWLSSTALSESERAELLAIKGDEKEIESRFFAPLEFGTAGLRGIIGAGVRRMNIHVVRQATHAFARLIAERGEDAKRRGCAVCFDCRFMSREFAREAACVLAANGVSVKLFEDMRPTPELSFAVRHYGCMGGINITASHNPKEYNGYKVYWEDGAQLPPAEAAVVAERMAATDIFTGPAYMDYDEAVKAGLITILGAETDEAFLSSVLSLRVNPDAVPSAEDFKIVYTPFHGTGYRLVPEILKRSGYKNVICEPQQMIPDGSFPTVKSPNPEEKEGFYLAIELARQNDVDLIIGTDPDADRTGIVVRTSDGEYVTLSGNQIGVLLTDYIIRAGRERGTLPENAAVIKTIVTTEMARAVCEKNGVACFDTFTGFKFMAELIGHFEEENSYRYILAYEESYGYLAGDHARDKDAVTASMLIGEMAAWYRLRGMTLYDAMQALYKEYGFYGERTVSLVMPGVDGLRDMKRLMDTLRSDPPRTIADKAVVSVRDYLKGVSTDLSSGKTDKLALSGSDVLYFVLDDGTRFIVRPSGTEPKIKVYTLTKDDIEENVRIKLDCFEKNARSLPDLVKNV